MEAVSPASELAGNRPSTEMVEAGLEKCARILLSLAEMGHDLAAMVLEEARSFRDNAPAVPVPTAGPTPTQHAAAAYASVTRGVRRTVMLYEKLLTPKKPRANRVAARKRIIRDVEDAIEANASPDEKETLHAELMERLDRPDMEDDIADRPIADIVTDITRDLGIAGLRDGHPWKRRIPYDIAILNARAAQIAGAGPSEELLALLAAAPPRPTAPPPEDYSKLDMRTLMIRTGRIRGP